MIFKLFLIFASVELIFAQNNTTPTPNPTVTCEYFTSGSDYYCYLTVNNPNGVDDFTSIGGLHVENMTDADVTIIYRVAGSTTNVPSIICNTFVNAWFLDLTNSGINTISSNAIAGCTNLRSFRLWFNQLTSLPVDLFANNPAITYIDIDNNRLTTLPEDIFVPLISLQTLEIRNNPYEFIPGGIFRSQGNLTTLIMDGCRIAEVNQQWFAPLTRLGTLYLGNNNFTTVAPNTFNNLPHLLMLEFSNNQQLVDIPADAFRPLTNLVALYLSSNRIEQFNPQWVANMTNLQTLWLPFNRIEDLPDNAFANLNSLGALSLWRNQVKTLHRAYFGSLSNLYYLDLDENVINSLERSIFETANLMVVYFWNNVCASGYFFDFVGNRAQNMARLERCFRNFEFSVETTTDGSGAYRLYQFPEPGIFVRVIAPQSVHISLNPVNFEAVPRMEILLGENNNTRSIIRADGQEDVVSVSTPGILEPNSWVGFRIVFANWMVLVFRENDQFPFMACNMIQFYPINFYGIRTPDNVVPWSIQPLDAELTTPSPTAEILSKENQLPKKADPYTKPTLSMN